MLEKCLKCKSVCNEWKNSFLYDGTPTTSHHLTKLIIKQELCEEDTRGEKEE